MMGFKRWLREGEVERRRWDEATIPRIIADFIQDQVKFSEEKKSFYFYDGRRWVLDTDSIRTDYLVTDLAMDAVSYFEDIERRDLATVAARLKRPTFRTQMIRAARRGLLMGEDEHFDAIPGLLNVKNGTLNLFSGNLQPFKASDFITRLAPVEYDPLAYQGIFLDFLKGITDGDAELMGYYQRCFGYALYGENPLELFFLCHGPNTRNGKGTVDTIMTELLGDYATSLDPGVFESRRSKAKGSRDLEQIGVLRGARYASIYEPDQNMVIDSSLLKASTGNDRITGTTLYQDSKRFKNGAKFYFFSNPKLKITDPDIFRSRRMRYIPFPHHFSEEEEDPNLKAKLTKPEVLSGVLAWLAEGCRTVLIEDKLVMPDTVRDQMEEVYQGVYADGEELDSGDGIKDFFEQQMVYEKGERITAQAAYQRYQAFCENCGFQWVSRRDFKDAIRRLGVMMMESGHQDHFIGWTLRDVV